MTFRPSPKAPSGFTLVELRITVAIAGILAGFALPAYNQFVLNQRIKSAAYDLYGSIAYARSEAIARGLSVLSVKVLANETSGKSWEQGWKVGICNKDPCDDFTPLKDYQSLPKLSIYAINSAGDAQPDITFKMSGRITGGTTTFYIRDANGATGIKYRCVTVGLSGQPFVRVDSNADGDCANG